MSLLTAAAMWGLNSIHSFPIHPSKAIYKTSLSSAFLTCSELCSYGVTKSTETLLAKVLWLLTSAED